MSHPLSLRFAFAVSLASVAFLVGCGSGALSKNDMSRYAISRGGDDEEEDRDDGSPPPAAIKPAPTKPPANNTPKPDKAKQPESSATESPTPSGRPSLGAMQAKQDTGDEAAVAEVTEVDVGPTTMPLVGGVKHLDDRKPAEPLSKAEARRISAENVNTLAEALTRFVKESDPIPGTVIRDSLGRPGLSWRVRLLPFLGYEELYKKFNLKEAWDGPTNKPLLKYIPKEFCSPDRYDEYTNYQLFVNGQALFSEKGKRLYFSEVSDAPRVLLMAEFDDDFAVPWTSPYDYDATEEPLDRGLGHLRDDGVFVAWLTGKAGLWPKPIQIPELKAAVSFEAGDSFAFLKYAVYPPELPGGSGRPTLGGTSKVAAATANLPEQANAAAAMADAAYQNATTSGGLSGLTRIAVPSRDELVAAEGKMKDTYGDAFAQARAPSEFARLGKKIYEQITKGTTQAVNTDDGDDGSVMGVVDDDDDDDGNGTGFLREITAPPAELFVGLRSALNLAVRGQDTTFALQMLREMDARFEIDRRQYETNLLLGFLGQKGTLRTRLNEAGNLLPMMEGLINSYIQDDDFKNAQDNLGYALPAVRALNNVETSYRWDILRERVETGKKQFRRVSRHIATLRQEPDSIEANHSVGWYLCMVKGNWADGAKHLEKSQDVELRELALLETQTDTLSLSRHVALGDGWWDYGNANKDDDLVFEASMDRARYWYVAASIGLADGLDRIRANNRIGKINRMIGDPPPGTMPNGRSL